MKKLSEIKKLGEEKAKKKYEKQLNKKKILKQKTYDYYMKNNHLYKIICKKIKKGDYVFHIGKYDLPYYNGNLIPQLEGLYNAMCDLAIKNPEVFEGLYMRKDWLISHEDVLTLFDIDYIIRFIYRPAFENDNIFFEDEGCVEDYIEVTNCQKI